MNINEVKWTKIKLKQYNAPLPDIRAKATQELSVLKNKIKPGMKVAVAVGSRGINNIALITKCTVDFIKSCGGVPFIVPAMGSHGGATAEGQTEVLHSYGVTEDYTGAPIISSMDVVQIGSTGGTPDIPVYLDKNAWESDGVIAINRVKLHTDYHGTHESGVIKMLTIGLGKHKQALEIHKYGYQGLRDYIPLVSSVIIDSGKIIGTLAILEDGYDNTSDIGVASGKDIFRLDSEFVELSRKTIAKLPFDQFDLLIVDSMGKNFSGSGLDTNVVGRIRILGQKDGKPECSRIVTLDLADESHGNAAGVGLSDVITKRLADKIDREATYENIITSGFLDRGYLPIVQDTDKKAINLALDFCDVFNPEAVRVARIRNTLDLSEMYVSNALYDELSKKQPDEYPPIDEASSAIRFQPMSFDENGNIVPF